MICGLFLNRPFKGAVSTSGVKKKRLWTQEKLKMGDMALKCPLMWCATYTPSHDITWTLWVGEPPTPEH